MRFYKQQHQFYCGIDLHAKTMHVCLVDSQGEIFVHRNLKTEPDLLMKETRHLVVNHTRSPTPEVHQDNLPTNEKTPQKKDEIFQNNIRTRD